ALLPSARGSGIARRHSRATRGRRLAPWPYTYTSRVPRRVRRVSVQEQWMAPAADDPRGPAPVPPHGEGEPSRSGSASPPGDATTGRPLAAGHDRVPPAATPGVLAPTDAAALPAARGEVDSAEADVLAR